MVAGFSAVYTTPKMGTPTITKQMHCKLPDYPFSIKYSSRSTTSHHGGIGISAIKSKEDCQGSLGSQAG